MTATAQGKRRTPPATTVAKKSDGPAYTDRPDKEQYRLGAPYISNGGQEYVIGRELGLWIIYRYMGGALNKNLSGSFISFKDAESTLISFLRDTDRNGYAKYPGKESKYGPFNDK